jgi:hypothetical protein
MIRLAIGFAIAMVAACGAAQSSGGSGSGGGGGSGYVECDGVQCGAPARCIAVVGTTPEQTHHECRLECKEADTTTCPKGQSCQDIHDVGWVCAAGDAEK